MSEVAGQIVQGKDLILLNEDALFDRVINVKFIRKNDGSDYAVRTGSPTENPKSFTLRSDYEIQEDANGNKFFAKCKYKPSIKIEYVQVTGTVEIQVKVYVTNLHLYSHGASDAKELTNQRNPVVKMIIQLGYFRQFASFLDNGKRLDGMQDFNDLTVNGKYPSNIRTLEVSVLSQYPVSMPPDAVMCFSGVVGSLASAFHSAQGATDPTVKFSKGVTLSSYLFDVITRRYPRKEVTGDSPLWYSQPRLGEPMPKTGAFIEEYGTKCYLSTALKSFVFEKAPAAPPPFNNSLTAIAWIIEKVKTDMLMARTSSGNIILYSKTESLADVVNSVDLSGVVGAGTVIPAIYQITYSGVRSIKCMYFAQLEPFMRLEFSARYNMANTTGYFFSPDGGNDVFFSIKCKIEFATVDDVNTVELMSTDDEEGK